MDDNPGQSGKTKSFRHQIVRTDIETSALADLSASGMFLQRQLIRIREEISCVEQEMARIISSSASLAENYELLTSIKGIGMVNAILFLCVTDNFSAGFPIRESLPVIAG